MKQKPLHSLSAKYLAHARSGVSLLIALILVGVIVLFSLTVSNIVITSVRQSANVNRANEAYYAAEGGVEQGLLENQKQGAGYTSTASTELGYAGCDSNGENCSLKVNYKVQGQVPEVTRYATAVEDYGGMYGIPTPGTGNGIEGCDPLKAEKDNNDFFVDGFHYTGISDADHPCNWNKIKFGDTVSIPLYNDNGDCTNNPAGDGVCDPVQLGLSRVLVRVRTPCPDLNHMCQSYTRIKLDTTNGDPKVAGDDTIVDWQIVGTNATGNQTYYMQPNRDYKPVFPCFGRCPLNSEIYESKLNNFGSLHFDMLNIATGGNAAYDYFPLTPKLGYILDFLNNQSYWSVGAGIRATAMDVIHKPVLKLAVITKLQDDQGDPIPYLEYQVLSNVATGFTPTDVSQTIKSEGYSGTFKQVLEVKQPQESGLLEYVIQQ